jgi:hypothetical protein
VSYRGRKQNCYGNNRSRVSKAYFWKNVKRFDRLINKDNIDPVIPKNREAYEKILKVLDRNQIPHYEDEDVGVQVLTTDMEKAEKLTNRYNDILYKSVQ